MRFQTGYYLRKGMVVQQDFEKVGRTVNGSGDTIFKKKLLFT